MLAYILIFVFTNFLYFSGHHVFYAIYISLYCLFARKNTEHVKYILCSLILFSLYSSLLFPLTTILSNTLHIQFPNQLSQLILSILFGCIVSFFKPFKKSITFEIRFVCLIQIVILCLTYKIFSYSNSLFFLENVFIVFFTCMALHNEKHISIKIGRNILFFPLCFLIVCISVNIFPSKKTIYIVNNSAVWATDTGDYDINDWTLKTSYSYSLMNEFIERKFNVFKKDDLDLLLDVMPDFLFYMTPTKKFNNNEITIFNEYLNRGGKLFLLLIIQTYTAMLE